MTYTNATDHDIQINYETSTRARVVTLAPGQDFTFDTDTENSDTIRQQLDAAGAQQLL